MRINVTKALSGLLFSSLIFLKSFGQPGSIDLSFNISGIPQLPIYATHLLDDGKILVGCSNDLNPTSKIFRLNADGTKDESFVNNFTSWNGSVFSIATTPDDYIILGGDFSIQYQGQSRGQLVRLTPDGQLDLLFPAFIANSWVTDVLVQPDGKIIVVGYFTTVSGSPQSGIMRLNADGSPDVAFNLNVGGGLAYSSDFKMMLDNNGRITIVGAYIFDGQNMPSSIFRINSDGTLDNTFSLGSGLGAFDMILDAKYTSDNKLIVVGSFTSINGVAVNEIARLNYDGSVDQTFNSGEASTCCGILNCIVEQSTNKIIIAGGFYDYQGVLRPRIARINTDGSLDQGYDPENGFVDNVTMNSFFLDSEERLVVAGVFTTYNDVSRINMVRINGGASTVVPVISLIGTATEAGTFSNDIAMSTTDGVNYYASNVFLAGDAGGNNPDTQIKFRQDFDWTINWGGNTFPTGIGYLGGPNINVTEPGYYLVYININTGEYSFTITSPPPSIGMVGTSLLGWNTDVFMQVVDGKNYILEETLFATGQAKFRQGGDWTTNWGGTTFPQGFGTQDGPNIPVSGNTYNVLFNRLTGAYEFQVVSGEENIDVDQVVIYPTPCSDRLFTTAPQGLSYQIIDVQGKKVVASRITGSQIDVSNLSPGVYFLVSDELKLKPQRIVKI